MKFKVVIPARYASTRLPAKPLLDLGGKPMVARVAERAVLSGAEEVWVATDHADIQGAAARHGLSVMLTDANHPTGTDRLAEVVAQRGWDDETIVVNVQGDEPLIDPALVAQVASQLAFERSGYRYLGASDHARCRFPKSERSQSGVQGERRCIGLFPRSDSLPARSLCGRCRK